MPSDVSLQKRIGHLCASARDQYFLNCPADVGRRIHQRAVDVEQINRDLRDSQAGCGPPSSIPGNLRPVSGLITCCVPSPEGGCCAASTLPSISCRTSLPSSTSRSSSAIATRSSASECLS